MAARKKKKKKRLPLMASMPPGCATPTPWLPPTYYLLLCHGLATQALRARGAAKVLVLPRKLHPVRVSGQVLLGDAQEGSC